MSFAFPIQLFLPVLLLTLFVGNPAFSGDLQKALEALRSGEYGTVLNTWRSLAEQKNIYAQYNLGLLYDKGKGVPQNDETAVKWYRLSAEQGYALAQSNLGTMYGIGTGVIQGNVYAHMWLNIAASSGHKDAVKNRDIVAKRMNSTDISTAQTLARECVRRKYKGC